MGSLGILYSSLACIPLNAQSICRGCGLYQAVAGKWLGVAFFVFVLDFGLQGWFVGWAKNGEERWIK